MSTLRKPTDFEMAVYEYIRTYLPYGKVLSYGDIVLALGRGSAQSVGSALAKNPYAPQVPCHRVVCKDGSLGGFHGETLEPALNEKKALLLQEGVTFDSKNRVQLSLHHAFKSI